MTQSIVIIEDDQSIRETISMFLTLEGYQVFTAKNGQEGLEVLKNIPRPNLVLLDLLMPVMDGWQFIENFDQDKNLRSIPIVILTAFADRAHGIKNREIVQKPLDLDTLSQVVKKHCANPVNSPD